MDDVLRLRSLYEPVRLRFPIEITVAGSSGLGWFSDGQDDLVQKVGGVARGFAPFSYRFAKVTRFPASNVYYLAPEETSCFHDFQARLAASGLRFAPTPYEYVPHCTIAILAEDASADTHAAVAACPVPKDVIQVSSVSFWSVDEKRQSATQGARVALGS